MKKEFLISFVISFVFLSVGFLLYHFNLFGYGMPFFVFLPFILGYILGNSIVKSFSFFGLVISAITFFALLLTGDLEGMVCILMALPLAIVATAIGVFIKRLFDKKKKNSDDLIKSSILPFVLFIALGIFEKIFFTSDPEIISVKSEMTLPYTSLQVYNAIKSVDTLDVEKPFLMKLDLPIPLKCVLERESVGGLRVCHFSGGTITEKITELEKAKVLKMDIIDYQLTGRNWLGFKEAIYYFENIGTDSSKIIRITTYTSKLKPRFYWEVMEKIGIEQEHEYVFKNLVKDLKRGRGPQLMN